MRDVNSSSPSKNQAASVITHALYDRRALDCTSTLPLINSLNNLNYLTTSSARIRQILTEDGGLERLVSMLKRGTCKTPHEIMKWYYALQCIVNIGVRGSDARAQDSSGSEKIRTRVVESDVVPVVATLLDNYAQGVEKLKIGYDLDHPHGRKKRHHHHHRPPPLPTVDQAGATPVPQVRSADLDGHSEQHTQGHAERHEIMSSPPDRTEFRTDVQDFQLQHQNQEDNTSDEANARFPTLPPRQLHRHHHRPHHSQSHHHHQSIEPNGRRRFTVATPLLRPQPIAGDLMAPPMTAVSTHEDGNSSQPGSPTTPVGPPSRRRGATITPTPDEHRERRAEESLSGESDEDQTAEFRFRPSHNSAQADGDMDVDGAQDDAANQRDTVEASHGMPDPDGTEGEYDDIINIRHRSVDGTLIDPVAEPLNPALPINNGGIQIGDDSLGFMGPLPTDGLAPPMDVEVLPTRDGITPVDLMTPPVDAPEPLTWMPRAEHIVLSLQLLAYVSKYCQLRSYFLNTHLVPQLQPEGVRKSKRTENAEEDDGMDPDEDNEYCFPNDFNLFPLVEKFTLKTYSQDMRYWACVVMRNLCRKDKTRGDIRQCAYYQCGKWESYARQFAKCRRCRQTKYCSKECQKSAWVYHRHWCELAKDTKDGAKGGPGKESKDESRRALPPRPPAGPGSSSLPMDTQED